MVMILVGYIYISNSSAVIDKIPNKADKQPAATPAVTPATVTSPNNTVKLAAFNLQIFGTSKADKPEVMGVLSKIIRTSILLLSRRSGMLRRQVYQLSEIP
jgi:hypothetical protein